MSTAQIIIEDLISENYRVTNHASKRMFSRDITKKDISSCAELGEITQVGEKFEVIGPDCNGEMIKVVCVYDNGTLIVTVMGL